MLAVCFGRWSLPLAAAFVASLAMASHAKPIPGSQTQVGAWRVAAFTQDSSDLFSHCAIYRVQSDGFAVAVMYRQKGNWGLVIESTDWTLKRDDFRTAIIQIGTGASFTAATKPMNPRAMEVNTAYELFGQLRSGVQLSATVDGRHYSISLDGVEDALARARECTQEYEGANTALVAGIQTLLARLGYDPGPASGILTVKTNMAISSFQRSIGERSDGQPSEALRAQLEKEAAVRGVAVAPPAPTATRSPDGLIRVQMIQANGTYAVPVQINGALSLNFFLDSGATNVSIPSDVFGTLVRTGTLAKTDVIGKSKYMLADGSIKEAPTFQIRSLKVGTVTLENVRALVTEANGPLLLGMSFLARFRSWSVDNAQHQLVLVR